MNIKKYHIVLLAFLTFGSLFAQGGSIYSRYGIGDLIHSASARRAGFGGLGSAVIDKDYVDGYNPASWSNLYFTRFGMSARYLGTSYATDDASLFHTDVLFSGFTLGFPLERDLGISVALGLVPVSSLNYSLKKDLTSDILGSYEESFSGKGSLSKVFLGASTKIPTGTSIGASIEFYTGANSYISKQNFSDNSSFTNTSYEAQYKIRGLGTTISAISGNIAKLFIDTTDIEFRVSALANLASELSSDTLLIASTSIGELERLVGETTMILPSKYTFGASLAWNKKYLVLFDYLYQPFTNYQFDGRSNANLKDLAKYSLGFEYKNKSLGMHPTTLEQMSFRCGVSYEETQYTFNGININQYSLHAGFSVPFGTINLIDFAVTAGLRGTKDSNLIQEKFVSAAFTLTLGELWFVRSDR